MLSIDAMDLRRSRTWGYAETHLEVDGSMRSQGDDGGMVESHRLTEAGNRANQEASVSNSPMFWQKGESAWLYEATPLS